MAQRLILAFCKKMAAARMLGSMALPFVTETRREGDSTPPGPGEPGRDVEDAVLKALGKLGELLGLSSNASELLGPRMAPGPSGPL